jgi:hypothetical protein
MESYVMTSKNVTNQAVNVINELIRRKIVKNAIDLSEILGIDNIQISQVRHDKRDFPKKHLYELVRSFSVNPDYLFRNEGRMFINELPAIPDNGIRLWCDDLKINTVSWGFQILLSGKQERIVEIIVRK